MIICIKCRHPRVWVDAVRQNGCTLPSPGLRHPGDHSACYTEKGFIPAPRRSKFRCHAGENCETTDPVTGDVVSAAPRCAENNQHGDCAYFEAREEKSDG